MADPAFIPSSRDRSIATQLHDELKRFIVELKKDDFSLESIAACVVALDNLSKEAERAPYPILHETGQIVENILSQSLTILGMEKSTSLLKAAHTFATNPEPLQAILGTFKQYAEATKVLLQELELLARDLIF